MVAHLVKLQLALQKAGFRRNPWAIVGMVIALLYALGLAFGLIVGAFFLRGHSVALVSMPAVLAGSLMLLGWCVLPLLAFGVDETLDPGRFALFPLRARDLMPGLLIAGFLSAGGLLLTLFGVAVLVAWSGHLLGFAAAVVAVLLGIVTCFLVSRVLTSWLAAGLAKRKSREFAAVLLGLLGMTFGLGMQVVSRFMQSTNPRQILSNLSAAADVLAWTPFGWVWAFPADVAAGRWLDGGIRFGLSVALAVGLWFAWEHFLNAGLTSPIEVGGDGGKVSAHSRIDRLFPATPTGAVAARSLRYWRRDSRHIVALVSMLIMPALILVPMFLSGKHGSVSPVALLFAPAIMAMMAGIGLSNEISYDGSALWVHAEAGIRGREDRAGRTWALGMILGPVLVLTMIGVSVASRAWALVPAMVGATLAIFLCALGVGSWIGALFVVPTPPPGERNAFNRGQSGGMTGMLNLAATWLGTIIPSIPTLVLAVVAALWLHWLGWVALGVGAVTGVCVLLLGIRLGGRRLDAHWPEVLKAATYEGH